MTWEIGLAAVALILTLIGCAWQIGSKLGRLETIVGACNASVEKLWGMIDHQDCATHAARLDELARRADATDAALRELRSHRAWDT